MIIFYYQLKISKKILDYFLFNAKLSFVIKFYY